MSSTTEAETLEVVTDARKSRYYSSERKAEIKAQLVEAIALGIPEAVALRDGDNMPDVAAVWKWRQDDESFAQSIAHARLLGHDAIAMDCLRIADDASGDTYTDDEGRERTDSEVIQRSKLRVDTRFKLLSKWDPKRYGDKIQTEITGADGGAIKVIAATVTPEQAAEAYRTMME